MNTPTSNDPGQVKFVSWRGYCKGFCLVAMAGVLLVLLLGIASRVREGVERNESRSKLSQISLAMIDFADDDHGDMPAPAIYAGDGEPLLSWRVQLLPYLGEKALYRAFKLDEPWDSPHNLKLLPRMPNIYLHPSNKADNRPGYTHYQVFVGGGAAFEPRQRMRYPSDLDGTSQTILIVEADEAVPWTKPQDITYNPSKPLPSLGGLFRGGFHVSTADSSVYFVSLDQSARSNHDVQVLGYTLIRIPTGNGSGVHESTLRAAISRSHWDLSCDW